MEKKILIIIPSLQIGGGAEKVVATLATKLSEKYEIFITTFLNFNDKYTFRGKYYSFQENEGILRKTFSSFKLLTILRPIRIYKQIKSVKPNIILSFLDHTTIFTLITKIVFNIKIPLIACIHTNPKLAYKNFLNYLNILIKVLYPLKAINKIITISKKIQEILVKEYHISKIKIKNIYNGIEIDKILRLKREKLQEYNDLFQKEDLLKFIHIGRFETVKGHKYLIKAFSKVKKSIPNSKLFLVGDGTLRNNIETLIDKEKLEKDIILLGLKKNPYKYLAHSDIFILSSIYEAFPMVLLESLTCSIPIISTDCETGPKEILENGNFGVLAKVKDPDDLAEKMMFLAQNKNLLEKFTQKSLRRAQQFDLNKIITIWTSLIESY